MSFKRKNGYDKFCGDRKVSGLMDTIERAVSRHDGVNLNKILESNTTGCIISLQVVSEEIENIEQDLKAAGKIMKHLLPTVLHLHNKFTFLKKRMVQLKRHKKRQVYYRDKYARVIRGPRLPVEIIHRILSLIPSNNKLTHRVTGLHTYADGLLPHAIFNPSVLYPYYAKQYRAKRTLEQTARQLMDLRVLDDPSLMNDITLRIDVHSTSVNALQWISRDLRLDEVQRRLVKIGISKPAAVYRFTDIFRSYIPQLEELCLKTFSLVSADHKSVECYNLKQVEIGFHYLQTFFSTFIQLTSLSKLTITSWDANTPKESMNATTLMLSQLPRLKELGMHIYVSETDYMFLFQDKSFDGVGKVRSSSLRSLEIHGRISLTLPFFPLFSDCPIDCIAMEGERLEEAEVFFPNVRDIRVFDHIPEILFEPKDNGELAFPGLTALTLHNNHPSSLSHIEETYIRVLHSLRVRASHATANSIVYLRLPRGKINTQVQEELEKYVPSLILT